MMIAESLIHRANIAGSSLATALRGGMGVAARPAIRKPKKLLELYDFEGCPYCRLVREVLTELDLNAIIYPCPKGGDRFRPKAVDLGGREQFPLLVDPNTDRQIYESMDIIAYLFVTYAGRPLPLKWRVGTLQKVGSALTGVTRGLEGIRAKPSESPTLPLILYSFESSPFARPVRELLCELEIPYELRSVGRTQLGDWVPPILRDALAMESTPDLENRKVLQERAGRISIPYLIDPNSGQEMAESEDILDYLVATYAR